MLKVLVADDHEIVRRGIIQILKEEFTFLEIGEAADTASLIEKALEGTWDIIISDIVMPGEGGIKAFTRIREALPQQKFLFISTHPAEQYAPRLISAGASGFVAKDTAPEELVRAVKIILSGEKYFDPSLASKNKLLKGIREGLLPHELLSRREYEVFILLASGLSISAIAEKLSISVNTISTYRSRILEKMNMKNNADLTRYGRENNLV